MPVTLYMLTTLCVDFYGVHILRIFNCCGFHIVKFTDAGHNGFKYKSFLVVYLVMDVGICTF